jgi:hypothetical protein
MQKDKLTRNVTVSLMVVLKKYFRMTFIYIEYYVLLPGSSVGIATDYGLDGPGSNPGGDEIFRPPRPALGPTQSPVL